MSDSVRLLYLLYLRDQGDQGKTRSMPEHRRGTEKSAEDLVGPPEWMESERRSTAVVRGDPKHSRRQPNGRLRPVNRHPPPSASLRFGVGKHRGGEWVRQFGPPCVPPGHAVFRCSGPTRGSSWRISLQSPRSAPPSFPCCHGSIGLFAPFRRPSVPM